MCNEIIKQTFNIGIIIGGAITVRTISSIIIWNIIEQRYVNKKIYRFPLYLNVALDLVTIIGGILTYITIGY